MYRLMIVAGPNRGSSFTLVEGENSIGRQMDNHIVLSSTKVSKRHCSLLVRPDEVYLRDETSTNGTFVNGAMVRRQELKPGDKLSVGDFVMELVRVGAPVSVQVDMGSLGMPALAHSRQPRAVAQPFSLPTGPRTAEVPQDLGGKLEFFFEGKIMPFFYGSMMKSEYRSIVAVLFAALVGISVIASVLPIQDLAEKSVRTEAAIRARVLAREVADRFLPAIANHTESQIDLSLLEGEETVKIVAIVNPNLQIIAPQSRLNQLFAGGHEAGFAMAMAKHFKEGAERGSGAFLENSTAIFIEPIKTTDPRQLKSVVSAMAIVSIDYSSNMLQAGGLGVAYGVGLVIAGLAAMFAYFVVLRLSFKPYEVLNDDLDQVLRGELPRVTQEFKIEETAPLWSNINAAVQRLPKGGSSDNQFGTNHGVVNWDHELAGVRALSEATGQGFVAFDPALVVLEMNSRFEEISGIHANVIGQTVQQVARDQSFVLMVSDLKSRVDSSPSRSALDEFEFSGVLYQVIAVGVGPLASSGIGISFRKKE